jgi:protein-S-isoprenylcysteine O-methyltransferase Ste14
MRKNIVKLLVKFSKNNHSQSFKIISLIIGIIFFLIILPSVFILTGLALDKYFMITINRNIEIIFSIVFIAIGLLLLLLTAITQWKIGNGTPAPNAPTQKLIISGTYKYCRNPIQFGAMLYYLGIGTFFGGFIVGLVSFILGFIIGSLYHKFIEEKELEIRFGNEYIEYRKNTPFLFPKLIRRKAKTADCKQ